MSKQVGQSVIRLVLLSSLLMLGLWSTASAQQFAGPNGQTNNGNFGTVSSQGNGPRQIQLAMKLIF